MAERPLDVPARTAVSAVVIRDPRGRVLTVRKRGTSRFMLPGGKPEPGEALDETMVREAAEELLLTLTLQRLSVWGTFVAAAANEPGEEIVATVFEHPYIGEPTAGAEIAELRWDDLAASRPLADDLAPLITDVLLDRLRA